MGLEAETICTLNNTPHKVKALLESTQLILRGEVKRKFPLAALSRVKAEGAALSFTCQGKHYAIKLGSAKAAAWARKLTAPPPTLASKLGLAETSRAFVVGALESAELSAALQGFTAAQPADAAFIVAVLRSEAELAALLNAHGQSALPLWLANVKGPKSPLGENTIRAALRAAGFVDTKTCAVSASLSATRYSRPRK
ncbi:MAG: hypothetical protein KGO53_03710 [Alphaproteobacteria bacterium]|nr:hypothetical protein [Alphaproteobacteria bacterium]